MLLACWLLSFLASAHGHQAQLSETVGSLHRKMLPVLNTKSGLRPWVDIDTPEDKQIHFSSRGEAWELVMSDEFSNTNRSFQPGDDPMWTSLEKPDGVNGALELYSHNMSSVVCEESEGSADNLCYLQIKIVDEVNNVSVYNLYTNPPGYENTTFVRKLRQLIGWSSFHILCRLTVDRSSIGRRCCNRGTSSASRVDCLRFAFSYQPQLVRNPRTQTWVRVTTLVPKRSCSIQHGQVFGPWAILAAPFSAPPRIVCGHSRTMNATMRCLIPPKTSASALVIRILARG